LGGFRGILDGSFSEMRGLEPIIDFFAPIIGLLETLVLSGDFTLILEPNIGFFVPASTGLMGVFGVFLTELR
jgi:hypothetical protein